MLFLLIFTEKKQIHYLITGDFNKNKVGFLVMNVKKGKLEET